MSIIKPIAPKRCPDCNLAGSLYISTDRVLTCRMCGYHDTQQDDGTSQPDEIDPRSKWKITYGMSNSSDVSRWAGVKYTSGLDYARQGQYDEALRAFEQAIDMERDFVDAHLWLARLSLDTKAKHEHYSEVIAYMPMNLEAQRELMVIKGEMTREEADRAMDMSSDRDVQHIDTAVSASLVEVACSSCGGTLEARTNQTHVTCKFCGHDESIPQQQNVGAQSLSHAMLKDRGQGTTWRVGSYLLHCDNCGSERIITSKKMTIQCPFCSSHHVIKADALDSFRQPDGIVPFQINPERADEVLDSVLTSFTEKVKGLFINNKPDKINMLPAYLPFWYFDVNAEINITRIQRTGARSYAELDKITSKETLRDSLNNVPYCAVKSPSHRLTSRLESFDITSVKPYDPKLLAGMVAEIYSIDYQQASLNVRNQIGEHFRFRHGHGSVDTEETKVTYLIQQMSFRLLMMPVWVANITEADGDTRIGLIHGQTGQGILGNASRLPKKSR